MNEILSKLQSIERLTLLAAKRVLNVDEASMVTGLSVDTLRRKVGAREIPAYRPNGKNLFFNKEELEEWMMRGKILTSDEVLRGVDSRNKAKKGGKA